MIEFEILEALGVIVAVISGVIAGRGRGIDLFGACFLGLVTCFGGGTVRDLILDVPVAWTRNSSLLLLAVIVAALTFFAAKRREDARWMQGRIFWLADAATLAIFSVSGCAKAQYYDVTIPVALVLGMFSGVLGGVLRDTLLGQIPLIFRRDQHFYATAALVGCGTYLVTAPMLGEVALLVGMFCVFATRLISRRFDVTWPAFSETDAEVNELRKQQTKKQ